MSNEQKFERLKIKTFIGHEFSICGGVEAFDKSVHATHAEEAIPLRFKFDEETFDISACGLRDLLRGNLDRVTAERDALQVLLTAADERADVLEGLLREARQHHGVMLMSDPPQDAWKYHRINERIDAALRQAEGGGDE